MLDVMLSYGSLDNYISSYRKELGLSQDDLAVLVGLEDRSSISRYEQMERLPDLRTAIALELTLDEPMQAIFAGAAERLRSLVSGRARAMLESMTDAPNPQNTKKWDTLSKLAHLDEQDSRSWKDTV